MQLEKKSPCKVNLLLNILGKRPDGFHELETLMHPVNLWDEIGFALEGDAVHLTCSEPTLPTDSTNLVHRAATAFLKAAGIKRGVRIHLQKRIPLAAGLGGGSGNAATTLMGLNQLLGEPLRPEQLGQIAASLGSDVPFFLQNKPALATGRGEQIQALDFFPALKGAAFLLIHPGFGISTAWAYQQLARFPDALNGRPGRAAKLIGLLRTGNLPEVGVQFCNSLEPAALEKYPLLAIFQSFLRANGAAATLMSGSGSTTFAVLPDKKTAKEIEQRVREKFGVCWTAVVPISA